MTNEEKIKWFDRVVKFQLSGLIFLEMKQRKNGNGVWVIEDTKTHSVLNSNMEWEVEPPPDQRNEAFLIRTRFDLETAITMYEQFKMFSEP